MGRTMERSRNICGALMFQTRLKNLHGMQAAIYFQPKPTFVLGSKDLGFNVFRTLICIVGKPWSKQCI